MNRRWFDPRSTTVRCLEIAARRRRRFGPAPLTVVLALLAPFAQAIGDEARPDLSAPAERALHDIYRLDADGGFTDLTLHGIDWRPGNGALVLRGSAPHQFPLLAPGADGNALALGTIASDGTRSALLGANPLHDLTRSHLTGGSADTETEVWFENVLGWLLDSDMPFHPGARPLKVVLADLNGLEPGTPDAITRRWFEHRSPAVELSDAWRCDGARLLDCLDDADLVVLGPGGSLGDAGSDLALVDARMHDETGSRRALAAVRAAGVPLLYLHESSRRDDDAPTTLTAFGVAGRVARTDVAVMHGGAPLAGPEAPELAAALPVLRR